MLSSIVRRLCPSWLSDRRDDITQSALLRVLQARHRHPENSLQGEENRPPPTSYLWKAAYSTMVDEIRRFQRHPEVSLEGVDPAPDGREPSIDPDEAHEIGRAIQMCWRRLSETRRTVVGLFLLGYGRAEIEPILAWNTKKVDNLLHRGLRDLRTCLRSQGIHR
ncbi:MAG: RNA polymerase sigma factor [Acidobacteriota bacterium]